MLDHAQAAAYGGADLSSVHSGVVSAYIDRFGRLGGGVLLDLGCGTADVSIRFAQAFSGIRVHGVDGSDAMLAEGEQRVRAARLDTRIGLERRLVPDERLETRSFDAVIANSLLHHLADPQVLWRTVCRAAKPGAPVLVVDLRRPADAAAVRALVSEHAGDAHPLVQRDFTNSLHAAYTVEEVRRQLAEAGVPFTVDPAGDLHLVVAGLAP